MSDQIDWFAVAGEIRRDSEAQGVDLSAHRFFACVRARYPFAKNTFVPLGMPFDFIHEMHRAIASRNGDPVYVLEPANGERPIIFVQDPSAQLGAVEG